MSTLATRSHHILTLFGVHDHIQAHKEVHFCVWAYNSSTTVEFCSTSSQRRRREKSYTTPESRICAGSGLADTLSGQRRALDRASFNFNFVAHKHVHHARILRLAFSAGNVRHPSVSLKCVAGVKIICRNAKRIYHLNVHLAGPEPSSHSLIGSIAIDGSYKMA
jgi:hypothetical protein